MKCSVCILLLLFSILSRAQDAPTPAVFSRPLYIAVSSGVNNTVGIIGASIEKRLTPVFAVEGGIGHSVWWGEKVCLGSKLYFSSGKNPFAFSAGMTVNTGLKNVDMSYNHHGIGAIDQHTDLLPIVAVYLGVSKHWRLARGIRIFMGLGGSFGLPAPKYSNPNVNTYESTAPQASTFYTTPGGPMLTTGLSFRVSGGKKHKA